MNSLLLALFRSDCKCLYATLTVYKRDKLYLSFVEIAERLPVTHQSDFNGDIAGPQGCGNDKVSVRNVKLILGEIREPN
jgi:hypothetical protein